MNPHPGFNSSGAANYWGYYLPQKHNEPNHLLPPEHFAGAN